MNCASSNMKQVHGNTGHSSKASDSKANKKLPKTRSKSQAQIQQELDSFAYFLLDLYEEKKSQQEQHPLHLIE